MSDEPLTHFDSGGRARIVAIDDKPPTKRRAVAHARIRMDPATLARVRAGEIGKGDVLGVARIAAIGAAKSTSSLIPLCHPVALTAVEVEFSLVDAPAAVQIRVEVRAVDRTGPEMEALTAAGVAALTIYDMCKAMDRGMVVEEICLLEKSGGKSGDWTR